MIYIEFLSGFLNRFLGLVFLVFVVFQFLLFKFYLPGYIKKKGENLATKEDVAGITHQVERVRTQYLVDLEGYKNLIWKGQQREVWLKEEFDLRLDTYKTAISLIYKYVEQIENYHIAHLSSGVNEAIFLYIEAKEEAFFEGVKESYRVEYESTREKSLEWYFKCKEVEVELRVALGVVDVYFDSELSGHLDGLIAKGVDAARTFCRVEELYRSVESEYEKLQNYVAVSNAVIKKYHVEFKKLIPTVEAELCLKNLKGFVVRERREILEGS